MVCFHEGKENEEHTVQPLLVNITNITTAWASPC